MMKTETEQRARRTWLHALNEAAKRQNVELPTFDTYGMGSLRSATTLGDRFVTLKRQLPGVKSGFDGVEWALWKQVEDQPLLIAAFRDAPEPEDDRVAPTLMILKGWLVEDWSIDETKRAVSEHPGFEPLKAFEPLVATR